MESDEVRMVLGRVGPDWHLKHLKLDVPLARGKEVLREGHQAVHHVRFCARGAARGLQVPEQQGR